MKQKNVMKKIVRLTESDLVRLVKTVIKEQKYKSISDEKISKLGFKRIDKIGIWIQVNGDNIMMDLFAKKENFRGCEFLAMARSEDDVRVLNFQCTNPTKLEVYRVVKEKVGQAIISKEAGNRLINGCGCKDYVKTDMSSSGQDYV